MATRLQYWNGEEWTPNGEFHNAESAWDFIGSETPNFRTVMPNGKVSKSTRPEDIKEVLYYIQNEGFCGNAMFWWAKDHKGYTIDIRKAHKFTIKEARAATKRSEDTFWSCNYIDNLIFAKKLIIDSQYPDTESSMGLASNQNDD